MKKRLLALALCVSLALGTTVYAVESNSENAQGENEGILIEELSEEIVDAAVETPDEGDTSEVSEVISESSISSSEIITSETEETEESGETGVPVKEAEQEAEVDNETEEPVLMMLGAPAGTPISAEGGSYSGGTEAAPVVYYVPDGGVTLTGDITINGHIKIDLNGNVLKVEPSAKISVNSGELILVDSGTDGAIDGQNKERQYAAVSILSASARFTMEDGIIRNFKNTYKDISDPAKDELHRGGAVRNYTGCFVMNGGKLTGNSCSAGGGLWSRGKNDSNNIINGGEISGNTANTGGGVWVEKITVSSGKITGNSASRYGGGVYGFVIMSGGEISSNHADEYGGGIYGMITMSDGKITGNTANYGAGLYNTGCDSVPTGNLSTMTGGEISGNTANGKGDGIYNYAKFNMVAGTISGKEAVYQAHVFNLNQNGIALSDTVKLAYSMGDDCILNNTIAASTEVAVTKIDVENPYEGRVIVSYEQKPNKKELKNYKLVSSLAGQWELVVSNKNIVLSKSAPVWVYRTGAAEPYGKYNTLYEAVNNTASAGGKTGLQDGDLIEFHGNTMEIKQTAITKSNITIKSTDGECFTADYSNFDVNNTGSNSQDAINVTGTGLNVSNIVFQNLSNPEESHRQSVHLFYINGVEVTLGKNCTIQNINCPHTSNGAAVYIDGGKVAVDGATIANNVSMHGAAFFVTSNGVLEINDTPDDGAVTTIENNAVLDDGGCGGGINNGTGTVIVNGGLFKGNYGRFGGGIYSRSKLYVYGGTFTENSESAISCSEASTLVIGNEDGTGPHIYENTAKYGAAVQIQNWTKDGSVATAVINGGTFTDNHASIDGGALTTRGQKKNVKLTINGGTFTGNTAQTSGGVIDIVEDTIVEVNGGTFSENTALSAESYDGTLKPGRGGAFINRGELYINGGTIEKNKVVDLEEETTLGGAVYNTGNLYVNGGIFTDNSANNGNGIYQNGNMYLSGAPVIGADQDVYLPTDSTDDTGVVRVITKNGEITAESQIPVTLGLEKDNLYRYRDVLVSSEKAVVPADLGKFTVLNSAELLEKGLNLSYSEADSKSGKPVLELDAGGPFYVVSLGIDFPTLQQAVDAAGTTDTILVHTEYYGEKTYGYTYATIDASALDAANSKGRVYIEDKNITLKNEDGRDSAVLDGFEIVLTGFNSAPDYTFEDLTFTGASLIVPVTFSPPGKVYVSNLGDLTFKNVYAEVEQGYLDGTYVVYNRNDKCINIGTSMYTTSAFIQGNQRNGTGTIDSFSVTGCDFTVVGGGRIINGDFRSCDLTIKNNVFGKNADKKRVDNNAFVMERLPGGDINLEVSGNTYYVVDAFMSTVYLNADHSSGNVNVVYHDNELFTPNGKKAVKDDGTIRALGIVTNVFKNGKVITYHNYVNGYCENEFNVGTGGVVLDKQCGHTLDEHIKDVADGYKKAEDTYQNGKADGFTGGEHSTEDLGDKRYCDRCDELEEEKVKYTYVPVCKGTVEEGTVFGTVNPAEEEVGKITGKPESTAEAKEGFIFLGWYDNAAGTGEALSTEATFKPDNRDEKDLLKGGTFYALFSAENASLTITKIADKLFDTNDRFIFTVTGPDGFSTKVVVQAENSVTIQDLPLGEYTVKEDASWSWRYTTEAEKTVELTSDGVEVKFANTLNNKKWLGGSAEAINKIASGN